MPAFSSFPASAAARLYSYMHNNRHWNEYVSGASRYRMGERPESMRHWLISGTSVYSPRVASKVHSYLAGVGKCSRMASAIGALQPAT